MTIAITGATGFVGQALLDEAERGGLELRALTRREQKPRKGVEWVRGDLADTRALRKLARGADGLCPICSIAGSANFDMIYSLIPTPREAIRTDPLLLLRGSTG